MILRPEFSRPIRVSRIAPASGDSPASAIEQTVVASGEECRALAGRLGVPAVGSLVCSFRMLPVGHGAVEAAGELRAELTRICVVSLEAFETTVVERFVVRFVPASRTQPASDEIDPEAPDEIGYEGGQIDLGEAASEQLALALDPYPRMPGVARPGQAVAETEPEDPAADADAPSPFAALAGKGRA